MNKAYHLLFLLLFLACPLQAADQDTEQQLYQRDMRASQAQQQAILSALPAEPLAPSPQGQLPVTLAASAKALHQAVRAQNWPLAQRLLQHYQGFGDADPLLSYFAQGALARSAGDLAGATQAYRALLGLEPSFTAAKLELARVLFEDHQDKAAQQLFSEIAAQLPKGHAHSAGVLRRINIYRHALLQRQRWRASLRTAVAYNDNINSSSASSLCLATTSNGECFLQRTTPDKIDAFALDYDASLNLRRAWKGHHGWQLQGLLYGTQFHDYSSYNEFNGSLAIGYSYQSARNQYTLMPHIAYSNYANNSLYWSPGLQASWLHQSSRDRGWRMTLKGEYQNYQSAQRDYQSDWLWTGKVSAWLPFYYAGSSYAGLDWSSKENSTQIYAYQLYGGYLGWTHRVASWLQLNLFSAYRVREYGAYNSMLGARRRDKELNLNLQFTLSSLSWQGVTPQLRVGHKRVTSNIDWLYSYQQNEFSLSFEKRF